VKAIMRILFAICLGAAMCAHVSAARAQTADGAPPSDFEVKIQTEGEGAPRFTVTNLTDYTLTACVIKISSSTDRRERSEMVWDALLQNVPPIEAHGSFLQHLAHRTGGPLPDRVEMVAAVWIGRENFGEAKWLDRILENRDLAEAEYDQAIALLREGMERNWTRAQYLQAIEGKPNSRAFDSVRMTLTANPKLDEHPEWMNRIVQKMLDGLIEKSEQLKKAKAAPVAASSN
jgi:hypothetical protein